MDRRTITALFAWFVLGPELLAVVSCFFFEIISKDMAVSILLLSVIALKMFAVFYGLRGLGVHWLDLSAIYFYHDLDISYYIVFGPGMLVETVAAYFGIIRLSTVYSITAMFFSFRITIAGIVAFYCNGLHNFGYCCCRAVGPEVTA